MLLEPALSYPNPITPNSLSFLTHSENRKPWMQTLLKILKYTGVLFILIATFVLIIRLISSNRTPQIQLRNRTNPLHPQNPQTNPSERMEISIKEQLGRCEEQRLNELPKNFVHSEAPFEVMGIDEQLGNTEVGICYDTGAEPSGYSAHAAIQFLLDIQNELHPVQVFALSEGFDTQEAVRCFKTHFEAVLRENLSQCNTDELSELGIWTALQTTHAKLQADFQNDDATSIFVVLMDGAIWVCNDGNARAFLLERNKTCTQLTEDRDPLNPRLQITRIPLKPGILSITSKEVKQAASTSEIADYLIRARNNAYPGDLARNLIHSVRESGVKDNLTTILVEI